MRRFAFAASITTLALAGTAAAQGYGQYNGYGQQTYNQGYGQQVYAQSDGCKAERDQQKLVGGLIGGALGAVAGAAIGNNLGDGSNHHRRGYRGHGYGYGSGYGYGNGGYNDHYRHNRPRRRSGNDDTEQIVAGLILGAVGAVAGSEIAASNVDCNTQVYQGVPAPTRQAYGNAWEQGNAAPYQQAGELYGGQYGQRNSNTNAYGNERNGADKRECEPVYRETRLPDGRVITEEVQACRDGVTYYEPRTAYGEWGVED